MLDATDFNSEGDLSSSMDGKIPERWVDDPDFFSSEGITDVDPEVRVFDQKEERDSWIKQLVREDSERFDQEMDRLRDERNNNTIDVVAVPAPVVEEPAGPEPEAEPELIDTAEAERMLSLLGIGATDPVILCAYGDTNRYTPARQGEKYDWAAVTAAAASGQRDWGKVRSDLQYASTQNLGFISCPGGTRTKDRQGKGKPAEIFKCWLLFYEIDGLPKDEQWGLWGVAGLPEPTLVLDTGNKSLHVWFRLSKPVTPDEGKAARKRLSLAIEAVLPEGVKTDKGMHSTHQPASLAGGIHPKTGKRSTILLGTDNVFELDELMAVCPELPVNEKSTDPTGTIWRQAPDDYELDDQDEIALPLTTADGEVVTVPLEIALGDVTIDLLKTGQEPGSGEGRRPMLHRLSKTLQCAEVQLQELGQPFTGSALELWQDCAAASNVDGDLDDIDAVYDSHWAFDDIGEGDLSREVLMLRLQGFGIDNGLINPLGWFENLRSTWLLRGKLNSARIWHEILQSRIKEARGQAELKDTDYLVAGQNIVSQLEQGWEQIAQLGRPADRQAAQMKLSAKLNISPKQMDALVRQLMQEQNEENRQFATFDAVMGHDFTTEPLVERLLARGRLTLLGALGGTAKSTTCYEIAEAVTTGGKVFGELQATQGKVLIYQADEPASDAKTKWERMGLEPDTNRLKIQWGFTAAMLPDLEKEVVEQGYDLVIMDSLTTIYAGGEAKMNDAEIGLPLYHLNRMASRTGCGVLLTHHLKKGDGKNDGNKPKAPTKADFFGSAFILNAVSDALGMWEMGEEVSGDPIFGLRSLKARSGLMTTGQTYQLEGSVETWRSKLKVDVGDDCLLSARTVEEKLVAFFRLKKGDYFTAQELKVQVPEARAGAFASNTRQLSNALAALHSRQHTTGVHRRKRSGHGRGKPPFEYGIPE